MEFRQDEVTYYLPDGLPFTMEDVIRWAHKENPIERMFAGDPTLWTDEPEGQEEIRKRLGWLQLPVEMGAQFAAFEAFRDQALTDGFTHVFVLGMGGSSLAPEVLSLVLSDSVLPGKGLKLKIIDTTNPDEILASYRGIDLAKVLFIVSSKSGTTSETTSALNYFRQEVERLVGTATASHFAVITDPGTVLETYARQNALRAVFHGEETVGGRFSVFSNFGMVPAALLGLELSKLEQHAKSMYERCLPIVETGLNPGEILGGVLGMAARYGRNKLCIMADPKIRPLGAWLEQLIAESSGKDGKGILPVVDEPQVSSAFIGNDRIFVYLRMTGALDPLVQEYHYSNPVVVINLAENYDLFGEFYRWEIATSVACAVMGVNAFDQPDVQANKTRTKEIIKEFQQSGKLKEGEPVFSTDQWAIYGEPDRRYKKVKTIADVLNLYLDGVKASKFLAINAFINRSEENEADLTFLRECFNTNGFATTLGFGPRFLHSTGQYHKGGSNQGFFLQITAEVENDMLIPGENMHFGTLQRAQALGDFEVLRERGRKILRIHFKSSKLEGLFE